MALKVDSGILSNIVNKAKYITPICERKVSKSGELLKSCAQDTVQLSKKAQFEKLLRKNHSVESVKINIEGKDTTWAVFKNSQSGSQDAFWAKSEDSGDLYYVKYASSKPKEEHIKSEILASKLYNLAGIDTPEIVPVTINGHIKGLASKYIEASDCYSVKQVQEGFGADAWLANWDSLVDGNTLISSDGKLIKLDNGGSLKFRAQGKLKPNFGDKVEEILTLVDGKNPYSADVYSSMTQKELISSFEKVCNISDNAIKEIAKDESLAKILINRKKYMSDVLELIKKTPKTDENLSEYLAKVIKSVNIRKNFSTEALLEPISSYLNGAIKERWNTIDMPSTKSITKKLVKELKSMEKDGIKISRDDILQLFEDLSTDGLGLNYSVKYKGNMNEYFNMEDYYTRMFSNLSMLAQKAPIKEGETASSFAARIIKIREKRNKQMEDFRLKTLKSKIKYVPELKPSAPRKMTSWEREQAINELEAQRKLDALIDIFSIPKLTSASTDKDIYKAWQAAHLENFEFSSNEIQTAVMGVGGRYNSKHPVKTKTKFEYIAPKDYKQEFENEPVYHWLDKNNPEAFVMKKLPKKGEIYEISGKQCCSTHKHYAEMDYGDHLSSQNIKFIIHPKSETSRAYNLGYNQEVVYPAGEKFVILDKDCVEYIDPETGAGYLRWEVHMQEV